MTGITGVSMSISSHPATEANASSLASSYSHQYDGRGISPVSDEEYEGLKSESTNLKFYWYFTSTCIATVPIPL